MRLAAATLLSVALLACRQHEEQPPPLNGDGGRSPLALLTGLPLAFGEGFALDAPPHPVMERLQREYRVELVDGPEQLGGARILLAAQPRALTAERLVALDEWVREGGRLLLLADPLLSWPSDLPLGDRQRPPYQFADTGLLHHWGLQLEPPAQDGPVLRELAGREILTGSPGTLRATGVECSVERGGFVARCRLGRGRATVIADADFLHVQVPEGLDGPTDNNLDALAAELKRLAE